MDYTTLTVKKPSNLTLNAENLPVTSLYKVLQELSRSTVRARETVGSGRGCLFACACQMSRTNEVVILPRICGVVKA
ncbi:MAG: hypothetical protein H0V70_21090 [Ktedonobacteraceae bacterium]|nr:hypothetical protein [Ktedonobacteraceae bacterium]